jgi:hypothetical protein
LSVTLLASATRSQLLLAAGALIAGSMVFFCRRSVAPAAVI